MSDCLNSLEPALVNEVKWHEFVRSSGMGSRSLDAYYGVSDTISQRGQEDLAEELFSDLIVIGAITLPSRVRRQDLVIRYGWRPLGGGKGGANIASLIITRKGLLPDDSREEIICHWPDVYLLGKHPLQAESTSELVRHLLHSVEKICAPPPKPQPPVVRWSAAALPG